MHTRTFVRFTAAAAFAAALAGCETTGPGPYAMAPASMSRTRAAADCWMATEKTAQSMDLDKRADLVNACIDNRMRGGPAA